MFEANNDTLISDLGPSDQRTSGDIKKAVDAADKAAKPSKFLDAMKYEDIEKYTTVLLSYRNYLNVGDSSQKPLGMRIDELRGLGELRDKIKQSRSLAGKFFDLFSADDIKMNFTITQWGPAFVRKQMFGTRGGSNVQGGLSPADVKAFEDTGLSLIHI